MGELGEIIQRGLVAAGDSIVNPKCDDCGASLDTPHPSQIGLPRQCATCERRTSAQFAAVARDYASQDRPRNRRLHVVRLPNSVSRAQFGPFKDQADV